jgi:hypothetical protein
MLAGELDVSFRHSSESLTMLILRAHVQNSANQMLERNECHMAKPVVGTRFAWPIAHPFRSAGFRLRSVGKGHHRFISRTPRGEGYISHWLLPTLALG